MIKKLLIIMLLAGSMVAAGENDAQNFAEALAEFNKKNYDPAMAMFLKIPKGSAYYASSMHMIGACHNMKYSDMAMSGSMNSKSDMEKGVKYLLNANKFYDEACKEGFKPSCDQVKVLEQVIITLKNAMK